MQKNHVFSSTDLVRHILSHLPSCNILYLGQVNKRFHEISKSPETHACGFSLTPNYKPQPFVPISQILSGTVRMDDFDMSKIYDGEKQCLLTDIPQLQRMNIFSLVSKVNLFEHHTNIRYPLPNLTHIRSIGGVLNGIRPLTQVRSLEFVSLRPNNSIKSCQNLVFPKLELVEIVACKFLKKFLQYLSEEQLPNWKAIRIPTPSKEIEILNCYPCVKILQIWDQVILKMKLEYVEIVIFDNFNEVIYPKCLECFPNLKKIVCHESSWVKIENADFEIVTVERDGKNVKINTFDFLDEN